jgi:Fe-S cluster assembly iron-binding protein IscA
MLTVTNKAAAVLKAAKATQGAPPDAGIRIIAQGEVSDDHREPALTVGFTISDDPAPNDEELKQNGLRIFVEDALVEPLDGRTLDVRDADEGPELVFR